MKKTILLLAFVGGLMSINACKKDARKPPEMEFKTGGSYTSSSTTAGLTQTLTVGIKAKKTEDELKTYNVSVAYDGATTTKTSQSFSMTKDEHKNYEKDVTITTRAIAGSERWIFTITDMDGNIVQKEFTLTVQ